MWLVWNFDRTILSSSFPAIAVKTHARNQKNKTHHFVLGVADLKLLTGGEDVNGSSLAGLFADWFFAIVHL